MTMDSLFDDAAVREQAGFMTRLGFGFAALGALALLVPMIATTTVVILGGAALLFWGVLGAWMSYKLAARRINAATVSFGLLALIGLLFLIFPTIGAETLTLVMVAGLLVEGLYSIMLAAVLRDRLARSAGLGISGVVSLAIGFLVLFNWPAIADWLLGVALGVNFLTTGLALILLSRPLRRAAKMHEHA